MYIINAFFVFYFYPVYCFDSYVKSAQLAFCSCVTHGLSSLPHSASLCNKPRLAWWRLLLWLVLFYVIQRRWLWTLAALKSHSKSWRKHLGVNVSFWEAVCRVWTWRRSAGTQWSAVSLRRWESWRLITLSTWPTCWVSAVCGLFWLTFFSLWIKNL